MRIVHFLLKCIVGLFAAIGVLVVAAVVGLFVLWDRAEPLLIRVEPLPERAVLTLDLTGGIATTRPDNPLARVSLGAVPVLREVVDALDAAATDERVQGLFLRVGSGAMSLAQAQELRDAILDFRAAGKPAVAFAESFAPGGQGTIQYYLASAAERLWLQPTGELNVPGFRLESPFLRAALDTLGIVPRMGQRGAYKGAMNMFTDSALPAPQRA
ncbi:MAG: S49 family peptidase, partial [Kiloniellaceae bacterium]